MEHGTSLRLKKRGLFEQCLVRSTLRFVYSLSIPICIHVRWPIPGEFVTSKSRTHIHTTPAHLDVCFLGENSVVLVEYMEENKRENLHN